MDTFISGFLLGGAFIVLLDAIEYFKHKKNKLCYHCGKPYKEQK